MLGVSDYASPGRRSGRAVRVSPSAKQDFALRRACRLAPATGSQAGRRASDGGPNRPPLTTTQIDKLKSKNRRA